MSRFFQLHCFIGHLATLIAGTLKFFLELPLSWLFNPQWVQIYPTERLIAGRDAEKVSSSHISARWELSRTWLMFWYWPLPLPQCHPPEWGRPVVMLKWPYGLVSVEPRTIAPFTWSSLARLGAEATGPHFTSNSAESSWRRAPTNSWMFNSLVVLALSERVITLCQHPGLRRPSPQSFWSPWWPLRSKKKGALSTVFAWRGMIRRQEGKRGWTLTPQQGGRADPKTLTASLNAHF